MKKIILFCVFFLFLFLPVSQAQDNKPVGIGVSSPDPRALLHLESTDKALFLPRLTTAQRDAQTAWKAGMIIYNVTENCVQQYNGTVWSCLGGGGGGLDRATADTLYWTLHGNSGTNSSLHFLGTSDDQPLRFRVNDISSGTLSNFETAFGYNSMLQNTGSGNTGIGISVLSNNTAGEYNTGVGEGTLRSNTTGSLNTGVGTVVLMGNTTGINNTGLGYGALLNNTTGNYNTAIGSALIANTTGNNNAALGYGALKYNTTMENNTAIGFAANCYNTTGGNNTSVGSYALYNNRGSDNTGIGYRTLVNSNGNNNVAIGSLALSSHQAGSNNIAIGHSAGSSLSTGSRNIYIGEGVGASSTTVSNEMNIANTIYGTMVDTTMGLGKIGINVAAPQTTLHVNGSVSAMARFYNVPGGTYTVAADDYYVMIMNASAVTLGTSSNNGRIVIIRNMTGTNLTISGRFNFGSSTPVTLATDQAAQFIWIAGHGWFKMN